MDDGSLNHLEAPATGDVAFLERALWQRLTQARTLEDAAEAWLRLQCRQITGARQGVLFLSRAGRLGPVARWPDESADTAAIRRAAHAAEERRSPLIQGQGEKILAYPLTSDGTVAGVATVAIGPAGQEQIRLSMHQLQWGMGWLRDRVRADLLEKREARLAQARGALDLQATALAADGYADACRAVVTALAKTFDADRASIGVRRFGRTRVQAISHSANFGQKMSLVRHIAAAMDEAIDQRGAVLDPPPPGAETRATRAHRKLAQSGGAGHVLTVPLLALDHHFGAVTLERPWERPFTQAELDLADGSLALLGPVLEARRAEDRWIVTKFADVAGRHARRLLGPGHLRRKLLLIALAAIAAFFWFARGPYTATADARLEGSVQRSIVAQSDGYIREAPYSAGDVVEEGALMVAFDDRELALERLRWTTERARQVIAYEQALAERDRAEAQVAQTQIEQTDAQIRLVDEQIARSSLYAPFAGLVVSGDLSQRIGASAERGEVLFQIAPRGDYRVLIEVDERMIDEVAVGSRGTLVLTALPERTFEVEVAKITPIATAADGRNAFRVEAAPLEASESLQPGMEGVAKILVDERRLIWIWTRPLAEWARLTSWRWWPDL